MSLCILSMCAQSLPGVCMGVAVPSTFTACCSAGSADELVADMLMHRAAIGVGRAAAGHVWDKDAQGEAADRSMAVPFNWRVLAALNMFRLQTKARGSDDASPRFSPTTAKRAKWRRDGVRASTHGEPQVLTS